MVLKGWTPAQTSVRSWKRLPGPSSESGGCDQGEPSFRNCWAAELRRRRKSSKGSAASFQRSVCVCVPSGVTRFLLDCILVCIFAGGHSTRLQTVSNKTMQSGGISSLASWTYLQQFLRFRKGLMSSAVMSGRRHPVVSISPCAFGPLSF